MHAKNKGNIGQMAVSLCFAKKEYSVFTEEGDISKIDLIAEKNGKLIRVQVKSITPKNGALELKLSKSGPNYRFKYTSEMFDYFAVYDLINDKCYFVSSEYLNKQGGSISLRIEPTKNNQNKNVVWAKDFTIEEIF